MCKLSKWFGLLSQLTLCAAILCPSPAIGGPITKKGGGPQIQAPAGAVQKKPFTQQRLKIVSVRGPGSNYPLRRNHGNLPIVVKVQNTSKERQAFYLRPELKGIPGSVQPSGQLTIEPLETREFSHVLHRINLGYRSGSFQGVVRLLNQSAQKELDSRAFTFSVADERKEEDLKVDAVKITRVTMTSNIVINRVRFSVILSNVGREIFGHPIRLFTQLRTETETMNVISPQTETYVQSGLQPGESKTVSVEKAWNRRFPNIGLWHELAVTLSAEHDRDMSNNHMGYSFIIDRSGKVIASKVHGISPLR